MTKLRIFTKGSKGTICVIVTVAKIYRCLLLIVLVINASGLSHRNFSSRGSSLFQNHNVKSHRSPLLEMLTMVPANNYVYWGTIHGKRIAFAFHLIYYFAEELLVIRLQVCMIVYLQMTAMALPMVLM